MNSVIVSTTSPEQTKSVDHRRSLGVACIYSRSPPAFMQTEVSYHEIINIYLFVKLCKEDLYEVYM
jgi:hypothetical protein